MTIHVLVEGRTLCGTPVFRAPTLPEAPGLSIAYASSIDVGETIPADSPIEHVWVRAEEWFAATCTTCRAAAEPVLLTAEEAAHLKAIDSGEYACNMGNCRFHGPRPISRASLEAAIRAFRGTLMTNLLTVDRHNEAMIETKFDNMDDLLAALHAVLMLLVGDPEPGLELRGAAAQLLTKLSEEQAVRARKAAG